MKIELDVTPEQWWVLTSEAESLNCTVTDLVITVYARTKTGRETRRQSIEVLHSAGMSDAAIGQRLGLTTQAVATVRRRLGLKPHSRRREMYHPNQEESKAS